MKTAGLIALLVLLGACAPVEHRSLDLALSKTGVDRSGTGVWMTWIPAQPPHALGRAVDYVVGVGEDPLTAYRPTCAVWAPIPKSENDVEGFALIGHEFVHCMRGRWHDAIPKQQQEAARDVMSTVRPVAR